MNYRKITRIVFLVLISFFVIGCESEAERRARHEENITIFIVILFAGVSVWGIRKKIANDYILMEKRKELEQQKLEANRQHQLLIQQKEQEQLHAANISRIAEETAKNKLVTYMNEIMRYAMMLPSPEGNDMPLTAINDTLDNIVIDTDIQKALYSLPITIQNDKKLLFAHFEECGLAEHMVVKRLKGVFGVNEAV